MGKIPEMIMLYNSSSKKKQEQERQQQQQQQQQQTRQLRFASSNLNQTLDESILWTKKYFAIINSKKNKMIQIFFATNKIVKTKNGRSQSS